MKKGTSSQVALGGSPKFKNTPTRIDTGRKAKPDITRTPPPQRHGMTTRQNGSSSSTSGGQITSQQSNHSEHSTPQIYTQTYGDERRTHSHTAHQHTTVVPEFVVPTPILSGIATPNEHICSSSTPLLEAQQPNLPEPPIVIPKTRPHSSSSTASHHQVEAEALSSPIIIHTEHVEDTDAFMAEGHDTNDTSDAANDLYPCINLFELHPVPNLPSTMLNWDAYKEIPKHHFIRTDIIHRTKRPDIRISHLFTTPRIELTDVSTSLLNPMWDTTEIRNSKFSEADLILAQPVYNQLRSYIRNVKSKFSFSLKILKNLQRVTLSLRNNPVQKLGLEKRSKSKNR